MSVDPNRSRNRAPRGFAVSGALGVDVIAEFARRAEVSGYSTFWVTVLAGRADPIDLLSAATDATSTIEIGLGLVPLSAYGGASVAARAAGRGLPLTRTVVALGVGDRRRGAARFWRREASEFRREAPRVRLAVGGYGAGVLRAGGTIADAVLLNWMTPERIRWALARVDEGAAAAGRTPPRPAYVYVSAAVGPDAAPRIDRALARMAAYDYHRRHQQEMAAASTVGAPVLTSADVPAALRPYGPPAVPVVMPVAATNGPELDLVMDTFAPAGVA
jgi:alkanesulfonate monooxygenase SsuD/methylene tetrahydromethanopterin reductase-like flavin-dependent oxidoreductase (luciferase family)